MLVHRLTPAGLVRIELRVQGNDVVVTETPLDGASPAGTTTEERFACASRAEAAEKLEARGKELLGGGAVLPIVPDKTAQAYYEGPFFERLTAKAKKRKKPLDVLAPLEARYGVAFPDDLRRLFRAVETHEISGFGEWGHMSDALAPFKPGLEAGGKNLLVQAVELDQKHYLGTALREHLCSLVPIGQAGNGDTYFAFVDVMRPEGCEIFLWDHEEWELNVFADSLSSLAYLNHLYEIDGGRIEVEGDVLEVTRAGLERLEDRVSPSWHYRSLCENAGVELSYEAVTPPELFDWRARWIDVLCRSRGNDPVADAKGAFREQLEGWHAQNGFAKSRDSLRFKRTPASVYWLFYTYFFDEMAHCEEAAAALATSTSAFVRDAAALFGELVAAAKVAPAKKKSGKAKSAALADGPPDAAVAPPAKAPKTKLGKISDVAALKKKFMKAETGAARARRQKEEAERAEAAKAGFVAEADAIARDASPDALLAAAREKVSSPVVVERLYEHLRAVDAEVDATMKRLELLADGQRYREHGTAKTWLVAHATPRIGPLVEARGQKHVTQLLAAPAPEPPRPIPAAVTVEALGVPRTDPCRNLLVALAEGGDATHLAVVDAFLATRRGASVFIVFERLMREALAGRAGKPVNLDVIRRALGVAYAERDRTSLLHRTALRALAAHAPKEEVRQTALRFLTWDLADVRRVARGILVDLGEVDRTRVVDVIEAEAIFERDGLEGLRAVLTDPWAFPKVHALEVAAAKGLASELRVEAIAAFRATYTPFREGHGYYSGNYDVMLRNAQAIAELPGPEVDVLLRELITSPSPLLSPAISNEEHKNRARSAGSIDRDRSEGAMELATLAAPPFVLGGTVHGLAVAGSTVVACGNTSSAFFDAAGRGTPFPAEVRVGWTYDADIDPSGKLVAVGYHACHLVILDLGTGGVVSHLRLGGVPNGIRKVKWSPSGRFLATASDDDTVRVVDVAAKAEVMVHREPYDVNGVAWLDDERLAFITDHHVGVLPRAGGEPQRLDVGGGADVIVHGALLVATTQKHGVAFIDPDKMKLGDKINVKSASRVRVSPDGAALWIAVYEWDAAGLLRVPLDTKEPKAVLTGEGLFALAVDAATGRVVCGGKAGRVHHVAATGELVAPPKTVHMGAVDAVTVEDGGASVLALDATTRVLRWSLAVGGAEERTAVAPWGEPVASYAPNVARVTPAGDLLVSTMKDTSLYRTTRGPTERVWSVTTERSEAALVMGETAIVGDGKDLHWLELATGKTLAKVPAGVKSSWIHFMLAVDDDRYLVAGYDDPKLALWSARDRALLKETKIGGIHEDGRYARSYGMTLAPKSRRLYASFWNETVEVIDPATLAVERTYDVAYSYEWLAVDEAERWLLATTGPLLDLIDLEAGERVARRVAPAEVKSVAMVSPGRAIVGLASGALADLSWRP